MKAIVGLFVTIFAFISFTSYSQDTITKDYIKTHVTEKIILDKHFDTYLVKDTTREYKYTLSVDKTYASSIYTERAGKNFEAAGVLFLSSVVTGSIPFFINKSQTSVNTQTITYICAGVAGTCLISSVVCFICGAGNMKTSAVILRSNKKYMIETDGTNLKLRF